MTRLELVYPTPHRTRADRLEHAIAGVMAPREPEQPSDTSTTRVRSWMLPNRRLARVARRHLLEAFRECGEPEPGVSVYTVRAR